MATDRVRQQARRNGLLFCTCMLYFQLGHVKLGFKLISMLKCTGRYTVLPTCDVGFFPYSVPVVLSVEVISGNGKDSKNYFGLW